MPNQPNKLFWLPFPVDRWLTDLAGGLLPEQKGALVDLVMTAWRMTPPCTLPGDPAYLAARSGLGERWERLAPGILAHFGPHGDGTDGTDGRLVCPWLLEIYEAQLRRYAQRKERNDRYRQERETRGETHGETHHETSQRAHRSRARKAPNPRETHGETHHETSQATSHGQNGAVRRGGDVSASRAKNLELRSSSFSSYELKRATAPEARASALEARAAPGARVDESPYAAGDDSSTGRAVDSAAAGERATDLATDLGVQLPVDVEPRSGNGPALFRDVLNMLRPARKTAAAQTALTRVDAASEERAAILWVDERPEIKGPLIERFADEWGERVKSDVVLKRMWKSACVRAYREHETANDSGQKPEPVSEHAEVSP